MSLSSFGSVIGDTFLGAVRRRHEREQADRMIAAKALHDASQDDRYSPEEQKSYFDSFLKTVGVKKKDADVAGGHFSLLQKLHGKGTPPAARISMEDLPTYKGPGAQPQTSASPAPAGPAAAPALAPQGSNSITPSASSDQAPAPSVTNGQPDALLNPDAPAQAQAPARVTPEGPTPASPTPAPPASMQPQAPSDLGELPTIGNSSTSSVPDVAQLPTSGRFRDPANQRNIEIQKANVAQQVHNMGQQNAHLQTVKDYEDYARRYKEQFGTDPDPHVAKQVQDTIARGYAAKMGVSPKLTAGSQAMSGQAMIDALGEVDPATGVPFDKQKIYTAVLDSGQNIIGGRERIENNQGKLVQTPDSPTGYGYISPAGKLTLNAPVPRSQQERETVTESWHQQSDGSLIKLQNSSVFGPRGGTPSAPPVQGGKAAPAGATATPASPLPQRKGASVIPSAGPRPMPAATAMNEEGKTQAMKSAIGIVADLHKNDLDTMANMISAGQIEAAIEPTTGALSFAVGSLASHTLTDKEQILAGKLQHLNESINAFRIPMGAGGFRSKEARAALIATKGKLGAAKIQTEQVLRQLMDFSLKQFAIRDKALAKASGGTKPSLDLETAKAYMEVYGSTASAIDAAKKAGYSVEAQ